MSNWWPNVCGVSTGSSYSITYDNSVHSFIHYLNSNYKYTIFRLKIFNYYYVFMNNTTVCRYGILDYHFEFQFEVLCDELKFICDELYWIANAFCLNCHLSTQVLIAIIFTKVCRPLRLTAWISPSCEYYSHKEIMNSYKVDGS